MSRFPMNLQLFAEGAEDPDVAAPGTGEELIDDSPMEGMDGGDGGAEDPETAAPEVNRDAIYAEARRMTEQRMNGINSRVINRFGNLRNPETGRPIRTAEDYFDALEAQERIAARREVEQRGVDPDLIDRLINNNPVIQQAQQVLRENTLREGEMELDSQIRQVSAIAPEIRSLGDIVKMDTFPAFDAYVKRGLSIPDAFRLANFEALSQKDAAANRQAAINSVRGKGHLSPIGGMSGDVGKMQAEIPKDELPLWEEAYPELSYKELKVKYNNSL